MKTKAIHGIKMTFILIIILLLSTFMGWGHFWALYVFTNYPAMTSIFLGMFVSAWSGALGYCIFNILSSKNKNQTPSKSGSRIKEGDKNKK